MAADAIDLGIVGRNAAVEIDTPDLAPVGRPVLRLHVGGGRQLLRAGGALADAACAEYEQAVLHAQEESRTALEAYAGADREFAAQQRRAPAAADAAGIVFVPYREGLVDSLARMHADRDALAGALDANRALTAPRLDVVDVYRALGGGWR